jgi:peptide/nickel transport system substrate-binding protein
MRLPVRLASAEGIAASVPRRLTSVCEGNQDVLKRRRRDVQVSQTGQVAGCNVVTSHKRDLVPRERGAGHELGHERHCLPLKAPFAFTEFLLGGSNGVVGAIMREKDAMTDPFAPVKDRIGSGPFRFIDAEYRPGAKLVYQKFEDYVPRSEPASGFAGGKVVKIDRVEWVIIPDTAVAFSALRSGEVDMLDAPPLDLLPTVANDSNIVIGEVWPLESYAVLRFNSLHPPFDNLKARQAVAHAFSQIDYMSAAYGDPKLWHECYAYWVCGSPNGTDVGSEPYRKPDLERARQLVQESGYDGRPVVLIGGSTSLPING